MIDIQMTEIEAPAVTGASNDLNSPPVYTSATTEESGGIENVIVADKDQAEEPGSYLPDETPQQNESADTTSATDSGMAVLPPELTEKAMLLEASASADLWHDPEGDAYATIVLGARRSNVKLRSKEFKSWMCCKAYSMFKCAPSSQAIDAVLRMLEGKAKFESDEFEPQIRIAGDQATTFLHLADDAGTIIHIDATGSLDALDASDASIKFLLKPGMRPLPKPIYPTAQAEAESILTDLRKFCNIKDDGEWLLYLVTVLSAFRPTGPFVVVVVVGEQGSAKSTLCRVFRRLVDPSKAPLRSAPREERDLWIAASNGWVVAFDNVSKISPDLSDSICRLATGGGNSYRTLYENDSETLFQCQRLVLLNTIDDLTLRGDLVDRAIQLTCHRIDDTERRTEEEFWTEFDKRESEFLGALLWMLSKTLKELPLVKLDQSPRMADFARFGIAVEQALALPPDAFLSAYNANRKTLAAVALENQLTELLFGLQLPLEESPSKLWQILRNLAALPGERLPRWFPINGQQLTCTLRRLAPFIRQRGIVVDTYRKDGRKIALTPIENVGL